MGEGTRGMKDNTRHCDLCGKDIAIIENKIAQFWHLRKWKNPFGLEFTGTYCAKCFENLHEIKEEIKI